jgi:hypothetical protein
MLRNDKEEQQEELLGKEGKEELEDMYNKFHAPDRFLRRQKLLSHSRNSQHFMEPEVLLSRSTLRTLFF